MTSLIRITSIMAVTASAHAATLLSLNFVNNSGGTSPYTGAGVLDTNSRTWDTLTGSASVANGGQTTSGIYGGITATANDYGDFASSTSPTLNLFDGYMFSGNTNNGAETMTLSGLAAGNYDLAVYAAWGFTPISVSFSVTDGNGTTSNKVATGTNKSTFEEGNNYVVFEDLTVGGSGTLTLNIGSDNSGTTQWYVSGLELVSVPEPSAALLGLAGLGLLVRRRRA